MGSEMCIRDRNSTVRTPLPFSFCFYLFFYSLFFFLSSLFSLSFLSLSVSHFLFLFRLFVLSSCRFPFDSCIAFFAFTFASLLSLVADSVILLFRLGAIPPPRSLRAPQVCVLPSSAVFFLLSCVADVLTYLYFFLLFLPFFDFDLDNRLFHPVSCGGHYAVSSVSVSAATRLA